MVLGWTGLGWAESVEYYRVGESIGARRVGAGFEGIMACGAGNVSWSDCGVGNAG